MFDVAKIKQFVETAKKSARIFFTFIFYEVISILINVNCVNFEDSISAGF